MGSFDGMDPTLVRDLLAEVRRAAEQMRTIEARVAQVTRTAGLATPSTHRPSQVADACETMARDVTGRLALLEKREAAPRTGEQPVKDLSTNGTPASEKDTSPPEPAPRSETPRDTTPTDPPPKTDHPKTGTDEPKSGTDQSKTGPDDPKNDQPRTGTDEPKSEPDRSKTGTDEPKSEPDRSRTGTDQPWTDEPRTDQPKSGADEPRTGTDQPKTGADEPRTGTDQPRTDQPKTGADESRTGTDQPRTDQPKTGADEPRTGTDQPKSEADAPKSDERDSRRDRGVEPDRSGQDILDTPKKDHPDDLDQTGAGKPQVVEVDGVKVLQIPLDPPTAREVADLLENADDVRPVDVPSVGAAEPAQSSDGTAGRTGTSAGTGDGPATWANDGSDVVSADARPPSDAAVKSLVDNARDIGPMDMPGVRLPTGEWGQAAVPGIHPDGPAGSVDPGGATPQTPGGTGQPSADTSASPTPTSTSPIPTAATPQPTAESPTPTAATPSPTADTPLATGTDPAATVAAPVGGGDVARWANDGSDVVSADARPPSDAALKALMDHASDIEPMDMPTVRVPPGEWGSGEWVAEDFGPDGEPGRVEANAPDRPTVPPGS
ncbi:hypothetical protein ACFXJ8_30370 [Nonomuraea sp. NPDC059194]|uniref:hypothetical protein n=1 Tax=Nonomuraea sp. NPDC059194 TaxID=3346764 RepID=UPI0036A343A6